MWIEFELRIWQGKVFVLHDRDERKMRYKRISKLIACLEVNQIDLGKQTHMQRQDVGKSAGKDCNVTNTDFALAASSAWQLNGAHLYCRRQHHWPPAFCNIYIDSNNLSNYCLLTVDALSMAANILRMSYHNNFSIIHIFWKIIYMLCYGRR